MDSTLATQISYIEAALRNTLDDISLRTAAGAGRDRTRELVDHAQELADRLTRAIDRLDRDDESEGVRRMAAYLSAQLAVLARDDAPQSLH